MLFADCEGCLCAFLDDYGSEVLGPGGVRAVIFERDNDNGGCAYDAVVAPRLAASGFRVAEMIVHADVPVFVYVRQT